MASLLGACLLSLFEIGPSQMVGPGVENQGAQTALFSNNAVFSVHGLIIT